MQQNRWKFFIQLSDTITFFLLPSLQRGPEFVEEMSQLSNPFLFSSFPAKRSWAKKFANNILKKTVR